MNILTKHTAVVNSVTLVHLRMTEETASGMLRGQSFLRAIYLRFCFLHVKCGTINLFSPPHNILSFSRRNLKNCCPVKYALSEAAAMCHSGTATRPKRETHRGSEEDPIYPNVNANVSLAPASCVSSYVPIASLGASVGLTTSLRATRHTGNSLLQCKFLLSPRKGRTPHAATPSRSLCLGHSL